MNEYEVSSLEDIDKIPVERREAFLKEAGPFFQKVQTAEKILGLLGVKVAKKRFVWVDDGKQDIDIHIE